MGSSFERDYRLLGVRGGCLWRATRGLATALAVGLGTQVVAQDVTPPKAYTTTPGGINVSDGNLVYSETDLSMGPLTLERYYRGGTKQPNDPMFGFNFSSNFDIFITRVYEAPSYFHTVHIGNTASGIYTTSFNHDNQDAEKGKLSLNGSQYVYIDDTGTTYTFSATVTAAGALYASGSRRVERIDFPDGRRQTFSYTTGGQPRLIEDSSGYAILFDYNGVGDVSAACIFKRSETYVGTASSCAGAAVKTSYGYTTISGPRYVLTSVLDAGSQTTTYTNSYNGVTCVTPPGYLSCKISQNGVPSATAPSFGNTQVLAGGGTWVIGGQDWGVVPRGDDGTPAPYDGHVEAYVTDPANQTTALSFTKSSPYAITDPLGRTTSFKFFGGIRLSNGAYWGGQSFGSMLIEATYPEGDKYQAEYQGPFRKVTKERRVSKNGSSVLERIYTYGNSCTVYPGTYQNCVKPTATRDPAGNWTNYTYAPHGGVLTEMRPAPTLNGARPLKVTAWVQRYAWTKNSGGALVQGALPVWVKASETVCQTAAGSNPSPVCDGSALQTVTTYEYGANGTGQSLMVKGVVVTANGVSLRTCYGYDNRDRKIFETQPNANLSSCS